MAKRLKQNHPLNNQLQHIFVIMESFGITIEFRGDGKVTISSKEFGKFEFLDCETQTYVCGLPPTLEYKLTIDELLAK